MVLWGLPMISLIPEECEKREFFMLFGLAYFFSILKSNLNQFCPRQILFIINIIKLFAVDIVLPVVLIESLLKSLIRRMIRNFIGEAF